MTGRFFEKLKKKRKEIADDAGVPPYIVFSDRTLMEMSGYFPQSQRSLRHLYGIGEEKLYKYGFQFLDVICEYCEKHHVDEKPKDRTPKKSKKPKPPHRARHTSVGEAFNNGQSIDEIMSSDSIKLVTVLDYLYKYCLEGNPIRPDGLLSSATISETQQASVLQAFENLGHEYLAPVFRAHNKEISYENLKILRLYYLSKNI